MCLSHRDNKLISQTISLVQWVQFYRKLHFYGPVPDNVSLVKTIFYCTSLVTIIQSIKKSWVDLKQPSTSTTKHKFFVKKKTQKFVLHIWWYMKGLLYYELLKLDKTSIAESYPRHLRSLSAAIRKKIVICKTEQSGSHTASWRHLTRRFVSLKNIIQLSREIRLHAAYSYHVIILLSPSMQHSSSC